MPKINLKIRALFTVLIIAFSAGAFAQTCDSAQIIKINKFDMPQLGRQRTIRIMVPKGYATSKKLYPVIYMLDGQNLFKCDAAIKSTWGVDSTINSFPADKQCIVVAIEHAGKDRITEYSPYDSKYGKGSGEAYVAFLVETLKPYIDDRFRTKREAKYTAIAGSSMGSLLAMFAVDKCADTFGVAGIFSPAFWIEPEIYTFTATMPISKTTRYYFTCGDKESNGEVADVMKMDSTLRASGANLKQFPLTKINTGAVHNEQQWRQAFPAFYSWFVAKL